MKTIYDSVYLSIKIDETKNVLFYAWKSATKIAPKDEFLDECRVLLEKIITYKSKDIIGDDTDLRFAVAPEIQKTINTQMFTLLHDIIERYAHVVSEEFISQLSVEQLFEENKKGAWQDMFVSSVEEAWEWIKDR